MQRIEVAPAVENVRAFYRQQAAKENLPLATIVARSYRTILRLPEVIEIENRAIAGDALKYMNVAEWTPKAARQLSAVATVLLAVEFNLVRRAA